MKKWNLFFILFPIFLGSCHSSPKTATITDDIIYIDISKDYPSKELSFGTGSMLDYEYVPIETSDDVLLDGSAQIHHVSDKYVVIIEPIRGNIFIFDRKGNIVSHFNHKGQGPQEYAVINSMVFDEKAEEIFVLISYHHRIMVYSITGQYIRTINPENILSDVYNFDDENFLVYDTENLHEDNYSKNPYMFVSKKDGSITSVLNIHLPVRYDPRVFEQVTVNGENLITAHHFFIKNKRYDGDNFLIGDISSDTIYMLTKNKELKPFIVRTPSVHSTDPHLVCTHIRKTDNYILLFITTLDYNGALQGRAQNWKYLMYEFETHEVYTLSNPPLGNSYNDHYLQGNIDVRFFPPYALKAAISKFQKEFEQLVAKGIDEKDKKRLEDMLQIIENVTIDPNDELNPWVFITHLK